MATILPQPGCDCNANDYQCRAQCELQEASTTMATITSFRPIPCHQCRAQHNCMATCTQVSAKTETAIVWKPCVKRCRGNWECIRSCHRPRPTCHSGNCGNWDDYDGYSDEEWRFDRPFNYDGYWSESEDEDCHHDKHHHHHHRDDEHERELYKRSEQTAEASNSQDPVTPPAVTEAQEQVATPTRVARSSKPIANILRVIVKRSEDASSEAAEEQALEEIFEKDEKFISLKKRFSVGGVGAGPASPEDAEGYGRLPVGAPHGGAPPHMLPLLPYMLPLHRQPRPPHRRPPPHPHMLPLCSYILPLHPHHPQQLEAIHQIGPVGGKPVGGVIGEGLHRDDRVIDGYYLLGHCKLGGGLEHPGEQHEQINGGPQPLLPAFLRDRANLCQESKAYEGCRLACRGLYASCKEKCKKHVLPLGGHPVIVHA